VSNFTESVVEDAALAWLEAAGLRRAARPGHRGRRTGGRAQRPELPDVVLERRVRAMRSRRSIPALPAEALEDAFRKLTRSDAPSLPERNRAVHRMLVDGVTVEYRGRTGRSPARRRG
jgi:type I restriction enzyme R subunit